MIIHVALFKFKHETSKEEIVSAMNEVRMLKSKIPQVIEIFAGETSKKESSLL